MGERRSVAAETDALDGDLIERLAVEARQEELDAVATENAEGYRAAAMLMPDDVDPAAVEDMARVSTRVAFTHRDHDLLALDAARDYVEERTREELDARLSLDIADLGILDVYRLSHSRLRAVDDRFDVDEAALDRMSETVARYLQGYGFDDIAAPAETVLGRVMDGMEGRHAFIDDRVTLLNATASGYISNSVLPVWAHEIVHKDNHELLVGRDTAATIRDGYDWAHERIEDGAGSLLAPVIEALPRVDRDIATGLITHTMDVDAADLLFGETTFTISEEAPRARMEPRYVDGELRYAMLVSDDDTSFYRPNPQEPIDDILDTFEETHDGYEDVIDEFRTTAAAYTERYHETVDEARRILADYGVPGFDARDETICHLVQAHCNDQLKASPAGFASYLDHIQQHYNTKDKYSEDAGDRIKRDALAWKLVYDNLDGSPGKRFQQLMAEDNREQYLRDGTIPIA